MKQSFTPLFLRSLNTESQNLEPSFSLVYIFFTFKIYAESQICRFVFYRAFFARFTTNTSKIFFM